MQNILNTPSKWQFLTEQERNEVINNLINESFVLSPKLRLWLIQYHWAFCFELVNIEE